MQIKIKNLKLNKKSQTGIVTILQFRQSILTWATVLAFLREQKRQQFSSSENVNSAIVCVHVLGSSA